MKKYNNFLERVKQLIIEFDFIGPNFSFQNGNSSTFQSLAGAIWSFMAFFLLAIATYFFGKECYLRQSPNTSSNIENVAYSNIFFNEFPFIFSFITPSGFIVNETNFNSYFEPFITRINYDTNGLLSYNETKITKFITCDSSKFTSYSSYVQSAINPNENGKFMCLDFSDDDYFSNTFFALNSTNWNIGVKPCRVNCADDQIYVINGILLKILYLTSFVDLSNYNTPVSIFFNSVTYQLDYSLLRRTYLRFVHSILNSDYGWLVNNFVAITFPSLDSVVPDDMARITTGPYKDAIFIVSLESPNWRTSFNRNYLKVTQAMANVGGLSHALILFVRILADPHLKFIMSIFIREAAIKSLAKNNLEMSISHNINNGKQSNKNLQFGMTNIKPHNLHNFNNEQAHSHKALEESACSDMKLENKLDVNKNPVVQTVIRFNNTTQNQQNRNDERKTYAEPAVKVEENKNDESMKIREQLHFMKTKFSYFSQSVIANLKDSKGNESFTDYALAFCCCRKERRKYYRIQLKATRKLMSIHTYTNMVIKDCNDDDSEIYDSMKANRN